MRTVHKDGSIRWVRNYAHPVLDSQQNTLIGIYGAVQDVTEQKQVQQEREDLIRELEAKNAELEQFAYTVSHDLKAPLITIKGFLGFLPEDARSGNVERLEGDLRRIGDATEKMRKLLDDLLELSRIGRLANPPTVIALKTLIDETLGLVQGRLAERKIRITIEDDLPFLYGDRSRLLEVLQNVFDNALKFMGDQSNPQIEIGGQKEPQNGFVTIFVRDNGIGIAPQYHEQIFGLFNRLNPKIDGTGVGLALAKRIVEFHGGRIWVESRVGEGATFYFTLPLADQASPASESPSS
ncbi:MAG TPA: ATP-binding protein [Anaerolineales bacterium]|nr:ATP-binding protein [Anaerolineales bacterium]